MAFFAYDWVTASAVQPTFSGRAVTVLILSPMVASCHPTGACNLGGGECWSGTLSCNPAQHPPSFLFDWRLPACCLSPSRCMQPWRRVGLGGTLSCNQRTMQPNPASSFLSFRLEAASLPAACHPSRCMQPWRRVGLGRCRATQPSILLPFSCLFHCLTSS